VTVRVPGLTSATLLVVTVVAGALAGVVTLAGVGRRSSVTIERSSVMIERSSAMIEKATGWLPDGLRRTAAERWAELTRGLSALSERSIGLPAAAASLVVWTLTVVLQWLVLRSFQPHAGFVDAAVMIAVVSLAIALPAAPGFVGVYHWAGQQALTIAFPQLYDASTALAAATVAHAVSYVTSTALGVMGLWYFGMARRDFARALRYDIEVDGRLLNVRRSENDAVAATFTP
jgi:uncharacterized membrane protein YbhN (UPF0104 family)